MKNLDGISYVSSHVNKVLLDNGVHVPLTTSGNGVDHWERIAPSKHYRIKAKEFRFLHVSSCFPRKGVGALLDAYGQAFSEADSVSLIIKTFANPHNEIYSLLESRYSRIKHYPNVIV